VIIVQVQKRRVIWDVSLFGIAEMSQAYARSSDENDHSGARTFQFTPEFKWSCSV
jgi:hypothetical protein